MYVRNYGTAQKVIAVEDDFDKESLLEHYENLSLELNQPSNTGRCGWQTRIC